MRTEPSCNKNAVSGHTHRSHGFKRRAKPETRCGSDQHEAVAQDGDHGWHNAFRTDDAGQEAYSFSDPEGDYFLKVP